MQLRNRKNIKSFFLVGIFVISIIVLFIVQKFYITQEDYSGSTLMKQSVELTKHWFEIVGEEKLVRGIESDASSIVKYKALLGNDYTYMTTTLGSLDAKELSTNPEFAALITKMLLEQGIDSTSNVGLVLSGSFPALAISTLAALQTLHADVVMLSSLGASSYGANQPEATWIDIENWLREKGGLLCISNIVSIGGEDDNGGGLTEIGIEEIITAAQRNNIDLYIPSSLEESINYKTEYLNARNVSCLINIGGNQASLGSCVHAVEIPNGVHDGYKICDDDNRGIVSRLAERGIPFIHLLNIKDLAVKNGIPLEPGIEYGNSEIIYKTRSISKVPVFIFLIIILMPLIYYKKKYNSYRK